MDNAHCPHGLHAPAAHIVRLGDTVHTEAGIVLEGVKQQRKPPPEFYYFIIVNGGPTLLKQRVPSVAAQALFYVILEKMEPHTKNTLPVHFKSLAEAFGVNTNAIYKQFKSLVSADIFRRVRKGVYRVNPHIAWAGNTAQRKYAVQAWDAQQVGSCLGNP